MALQRVAGTQVAGLFRGPGAGSPDEAGPWAGFSQPGPSPFSPQLASQRAERRTVTGSPVPRCTGLEKQSPSGIPQLPAEVNWTPRPLYVIVQQASLLHLRGGTPQ